MLSIAPCSISEFCEVFNEVWPEQAEDAAFVERESQVLPPEQQFRRFRATLGEVPVGVLEVGHDLGSYHPARWQVDLSVMKDFRGKGVGTALWKHALALLEGANVESIQTRSQEDAGSAGFARGLGFEEVKRDFWSVLELGQRDQDLLGLLAAELPATVTLTSFDSVDTPSERRAIHALFEVVRQDVPRIHPPTPLSFEKYDHLVLGDASIDREVTTLAYVGSEVVGFSTAFVGATSGQLEQGLTAVDRRFRGQGIAQALKARVINAAASKGYETLRTDNDSLNAPILAINAKLGFVRRPGTISWILRQ